MPSILYTYRKEVGNRIHYMTTMCAWKIFLPETYDDMRRGTRLFNFFVRYKAKMSSSNDVECWLCSIVCIIRYYLLLCYEIRTGPLKNSV